MFRQRQHGILPRHGAFDAKQFHQITIEQMQVAVEGARLLRQRTFHRRVAENDFSFTILIACQRGIAIRVRRQDFRTNGRQFQFIAAVNLNFEAVAVDLLRRGGLRARLQADASRFIEERIQRRVIAGDIQLRAVRNGLQQTPPTVAPQDPVAADGRHQIDVGFFQRFVRILEFDVESGLFRENERHVGDAPLVLFLRQQADGVLPMFRQSHIRRHAAERA